MRLPSMLTTGGMKGYILNHFDEHCIDVTCGDSTLPDGVIQSNPDHKTFMIRNTKGAQLGWPMSETPQFVIRFKEGRREAYFMFELHFKTKSVYEAFKNGATVKSILRYASTTEGPWTCKTIAYDDERLVIWTQATGANMSFICFTDKLPSDVQTIIFWFYDRTIYDIFTANYLPNPHGLRLKPISVGDKLGLVYWDGTRTSSGCNLKLTSADHYVAGDAPTASPTLSYCINKVYYPLLDHAGTINLINHNPELIIETVQSKTGGVCLKDHLWHVI